MSEAREHAIENEGEIPEELSDKIDKMNPIESKRLKIWFITSKIKKQKKL